MKKIGIFLAFAPEQGITNQGIGRLTAFILSALVKDENTKVFLAAPAWYKSSIAEFLADQGIDQSKIELIITNGIPLVLRIRNRIKKLLNFKNKANYKIIHNKLGKKIYRKTELFNINLMTRGLSATSIFKFILINSFVCLMLLPMAVVELMLLIYKKIKLSNLIRRGLRFLNSKYGIKFNFNPRFILVPLSNFRRNTFVYRLYLGVRRIELNKLIQKINLRNDIQTWFVPTLFWPEIESIKAKKIVAAPDVVFYEFPLLFTNPFFSLVGAQVAKTIEVADHFICYSEHVKQKHLIDGYFLDAKQISVVKHGGIDLQRLLKSSQNRQDDLRHQACQILRNYQDTNLRKMPYLKDFNFAGTNYIFYSSQIRPYKNFMTLVKAYEKLLRNRFVSIKLITTANLAHEKEVWNYIKERRLQYDILGFHEVSSKELAALNHLAICAVNPTLFEGGFPFTFTEAYSVGTPSVMSRIPVVVDEVTDPVLQEKMLFDPYNVDDMANKIEWAINHRDELLAIEEPLYRKLSARTWEMVADEYIEVFKSVGVKQNEVFA